LGENMEPLSRPILPHLQPIHRLSGQHWPILFLTCSVLSGSLIVFHPFMELVNWVVDTFFQSNNPEVAISYKLSAFHSIFNICNVCILIGQLN
jgi:Na+/phosphate symporter